MASSNEPSRPPNVIDDLEKALENCFSIVTSQEYFTVTDSDETKASVEQAVQKFLESARAADMYFLDKRLQLSTNNPEVVLKEETKELRQELERKEKLMEKHNEHLQHWMTLASSQPQSTGFQGPPLGGAPAAAQPPPPPHPQAMLAQQRMGGVPMPNQVGPPFVMPPPQPPPPSYPQGPLAYLEQTMSNIGGPDRR